MGHTMGSSASGIESVVGVMILGIETAVEHVGVAVGDHSRIHGSVSIASDRRHAESLTPMIQFLMQQVGIEMADLSAIAVDVGPGLFTGMRVGIASAHTMAWALDLPVVPVCSLDALAMNADWSDLPVAAALDARRGEMYWALYRMRGPGAEPQRITEPVVTSPEDLAIHLADRAEHVQCVGSGFERFHELFSENPWAQLNDASRAFPSAEKVVTLASHLLVRDETISAEHVAAMYLRAPDAEINWNIREASR
jgi:tRNA threonylcarbamoyladenosine biosynthesis protein TsaB